MSLPITFATLTSPVAMATLDQQFAALAQSAVTACGATGTNAITLTPIAAAPTVVLPLQLSQLFSFYAANTTSGSPVTVTITGLAGLGTLNLYDADGVLAGPGTIIVNGLYLLAYNAGLGGFQLQGSAKAWQGNVVPTVSATTGTITTATATCQYQKQSSRLCLLTVEATITTNGTGAGAIQINNLPFTSASITHSISGAERSTTAGKALKSTLPIGSNILTVTNYDGTYPAFSGAILTLSGLYQTA